MANGVGITEGAGKILATLEKVFSWGTAHQQVVAIGDETTTNLALVDSGKALKVNFAGAGTAMKNGGVTIANGSTPTVISSTPLSGRRTIVIFNESDTQIRVGTSAVTSAFGANAGLPIPSGQSLSLDISDAITLYGIHAAGVGKNVSFLEIA